MGGIELQSVITNKIEDLRQKLLDFSRRNPLIHTHFNARTVNHVRAVDELPDILLFKLQQRTALRFEPLPPLGDPLPDEQTAEFKQAVEAAMISDLDYKAALEALSGSDDKQLADREDALRSLKDKLREEYGLPKRQIKTKLDLAAHAKAHDISPSYELPDATEKNDDGRHDDDSIQTLFLPDALERALGKIDAKNRSFEEETGISVLRAAFGYLDWKDPKSNDRFMSPLILLPVVLKRFKTPSGPVYEVTSTGDEPEINHVLAEMFRLQFGIELPDLDGPSAEDYFAKIHAARPDNLDWKIRRLATFGIFPSSRLAMYHDLDTSQTDFAAHEGVAKLISGSEGTNLSKAEEYDIDAAEVESTIDVLIDRADASQFSALVDIASGRNMAIEGPPGTGKSQTIVNAIADALAKGKSVLFVAEKAAALTVVESKLAAAGLGAFTLPLIAGRATKSAFMASINQRFEVTGTPTNNQRKAAREKFAAAREELKRYTSLLKMKVGETDKTVHDILGGVMLSAGSLENCTPEQLDAIGKIDPHQAWQERDNLLNAAKTVEATQLSEVKAELWLSSKLESLSAFHWEEIQRKANLGANQFRELHQTRHKLVGAKLSVWSDSEAESAVWFGQKLKSCFAAHQANVFDFSILHNDAEIREFSAFAQKLRTFMAHNDELERSIVDPEQEGLPARLVMLSDAMVVVGVDTADPKAAEQRLHVDSQALNRQRQQVVALVEFYKQHNAARAWKVSEFGALAKVAVGLSPDAAKMRGLFWDNDNAKIIIEQLIDALEQIAEKKSELSAYFRDVDGADEAELLELRQTISQAGLLRFASGAFRSAKIRYLSHSIDAKFSRDKAVARLQDWLSYKRALLKLEQDDRYRQILGAFYAGARTNLSVLKSALDYRIQVDTTLKDKPALQLAAKTVDISILQSLPTDLDDVNLDLSAFVADYKAKNEQLAPRQTAVASIAEHATLLCDPGSVNADDLKRFEGMLTARHSTKQELANSQLARRILGDHFHGCETDAALCKELNELFTLGAESAIAPLVFGTELPVPVLDRIIERLGDAQKQAQSAAQAWNGLCEAAHIDTSGHPPPLDDADNGHQQCARAAADQNGLSLVSRRNQALTTLRQARFGFMEALENGLADAVEAAIYRAFALELDHQNDSILTRFDGIALDRARRDIAHFDRQLNQLDRVELKARLLARNGEVPIGNGSARVGTYTQLSLLEHYRDKERIRPSIRDLVSRSGEALQVLKPCWMMSPLAVAQYVPMGTIEFDMCIIDEASQMTPESAIGAIMRARQVIIVGDENQLAPTSFFRKALSDDIDDDDEEYEAVEEKSILEMANGTFRPKRELNWHYRSRHGDLIRFSNHFVYDENLTVFPSPQEQASGYRAVSLHKVDGNYHGGINPNEAKAVADAAVEHMRKNPDQSLGIVALNLAHASLIEQYLDEARNTNPHVEDYMLVWTDKEGGIERFFVKNLENVQGDERDVIFISTVYGPAEKGGKVAQRFGPIGGKRGKRRLNVLFSRAKHQMVTFTSMLPSDILATEHANVGVFMLKRWLEYSAGGALEGSVSADRAEPDSDFERHVISMLGSMGMTAVPQVGVAGYFIDIGVIHPDWPHGYLLGIECDGASYHSAKSARDRDRLRQEVLEGLGWHIYRIWSTDWFNNQSRERDLLAEEIRKALADAKRRSSEAAYSGFAEEISLSPVESTQVDEVGSAQTELSLSSDTERPASALAIAALPSTKQIVSDVRTVDVGSTVRVRYLDTDEVHQFTISATKDNQEQGIVNKNKPIAQAVLECEEGETFEFRTKTKIRSGIIEQVT
ncbi:MAG: DUF4011 domain-containing protein [Ahrensia sp.]